jgi:hypothetical protein
MKPPVEPGGCSGQEAHHEVSMDIDETLGQQLDLIYFMDETVGCIA